jgi:hypothetical protein
MFPVNRIIVCIFSLLEVPRKTVKLVVDQSVFVFGFLYLILTNEVMER